MERSSVVAGTPARQDGGVEVASSNREMLLQAKSRAELGAWEDEGGTTNQPLARDRLPELPKPNESQAGDQSLS